MGPRSLTRQRRWRSAAWACSSSFYATLFVVLAGKFFTGSFLWELDVPDLRQFIPVRSRANPLPSSFSVPARPRPCARVGRAASCVVGSSCLSLC